ncbi:MAG: hypothetical protein ACR2N0_00050 [Rubrobacteraceae bacterium]|nr:hypothetical protein [Rubrobacter sp.]
MARMFRGVAEFWREVDRGLAVGYGHERPKRGERLRKPESGICRKRHLRREVKKRR